MKRLTRTAVNKIKALPLHVGSASACQNRFCVSFHFSVTMQNRSIHLISRRGCEQRLL